MTSADAQLHTAVTIDGVHLMNQKKTDAFIEALKNERPDLAGLQFAMGDACRLKPEASRQFVAALGGFSHAEARLPSIPSNPLPRKSAEKDNGVEESLLMREYKSQSMEKKIDPSASVATLMQVLGHEDGKARLALVNYLNGLPHADATRAWPSWPFSPRRAKFAPRR